MANAYFYTPKYRPPGFATVADGWLLDERGRYFDPPTRNVPMGSTKFGVIYYRRPLTTDELEQYELLPATGSWHEGEGNA